MQHTWIIHDTYQVEFHTTAVVTDGLSYARLEITSSSPGRSLILQCPPRQHEQPLIVSLGLAPLCPLLAILPPSRGVGPKENYVVDL